MYREIIHLHGTNFRQSPTVPPRFIEPLVLLYLLMVVWAKSMSEALRNDLIPNSERCKSSSSSNTETLPFELLVHATATTTTTTTIKPTRPINIEGRNLFKSLLEEWMNDSRK
mmetsp:Transcript_112226/g.322626  ORF Transcript_112226/g.322626 Transcript_112226/m.322626 type:complete len:113 (+) Transcript_112226:330-668(+)